MTLSEFKTYVKRDFKRTDKDTELVQAYNDMLKWLAVKMPIGDYKFQSYVTTSIGIEDYELPCDLMHIFHPIMILDGSSSTDSGYPLERLTYNEYREREPNPNRNDPNKSKPYAYTVFSRSVLLTPIPDRDTYVLEIGWGKKPVTQSVTTDEPSLGNEYDEILKWGTLERLYAGLGMFDRALYWGSKYHNENDEPVGVLYDLLRSEVAREGSSIGRIRTNSL